MVWVHPVADRKTHDRYNRGKSREDHHAWSNHPLYIGIGVDDRDDDRVDNHVDNHVDDHVDTGVNEKNDDVASHLMILCNYCSTEVL